MNAGDDMVWKVLLLMSIALLLTASVIESVRRGGMATHPPAPRRRKLLAVTFKGNLESRADARSLRAFAPILFLTLLVLLVILVFSGTAVPPFG
jgi:hypothetical protein